MMPFYSQLRKSAIGVHPLNPGCSVSPGRLLYLPETAKATGKSNDGYKLDPKALTDARNANLLAFVGDQLVPRDHAKVSVFDGAVQGGDGCWEGMRVYNGRVFRMKEHIDRLFDSARALGFGCMSGDGGSDLVPTRDYIESAIRKTMAANGMLDDAHMRVTLTRGPKVTSSMNPIFNIFGCCLIVLPEWKAVCSATTYDNSKGISLITATNRRNPPACVDSKIHHNNMINNILPKIQANLAGAADSVMLDMEGMVAETNATNMFYVKKGILYTPDDNACMPGVTRNTIVHKLAPQEGIKCVEKRCSLAEFQSADEVFTTGTMGELTPVKLIDGRPIGEVNAEGQLINPITKKIQACYSLTTKIDAEV